MRIFRYFAVLALFVLFSACSQKAADKQKSASQTSPMSYANATKKCYLTFDDGPHPNDLKIIKILDKYNAKATFFYNGYKIGGSETVDNGQAITRKVVAAGHSLGNHSYSHKNLQRVSAQVQYAEITKGQSSLTPYASVNVFRPGFGASTEYSRRLLKRLGLREVMWNVDTFDWRAPSSQYIIDRASRAKNYETPIILMHSTAHKTVIALPQMLDILKKQGCRFEKL